MADKLDFKLFHRAVKSRHTDLVQNLMFADPLVYEEGKRLLLQSAEMGDLQIIECLVQSAVPVNIQDSYGRTPLHHAILKGHTIAVRNLINYGADPNQWWSENHYGPMMMYTPSARSHVEILHFLLNHGWLIDIRDSEGRSFLMWAASTGRYEDVIFLVNQGANKILFDRNGLSAFALAAGCGHISIAEYLLKSSGSFIGTSGFDGVDALRIASGGVPRTQAVHWLIQKGIDLTGKKNGLLVKPAGYGHLEIVELLTEAGVDVNDRHITGFSALDIAASMGHFRVVKYLAEHGAELDARDPFGETPLVKAVQNCHLPVIKLLLELGSDPRPRDNEGKTLKDWTVRSEIAQLLEHWQKQS